MMDWETLYRRLVTRLEEIADSPSATERMLDYESLARIHARIVVDLPVRGEGKPPSKEALMAQEGAG